MLADAVLALPTLLTPGSEPEALQALSLLLHRPTPTADGGQRAEADTSSAGAASESGVPPETRHSPLAVLLAAAEQALQSLCASGSNLALAAAGSTCAQIEGQPNRSA